MGAPSSFRIGPGHPARPSARLTLASLCLGFVLSLIAAMAADARQEEELPAVEDPPAEMREQPPADPRPRTLPGLPPGASPEDIFRNIFGGDAPAMPEAQYPVIILDMNRGDARVQPGRPGEPSRIERAALIEALGPFLVDDKAAELVALPHDEGWISDSQLGAIGIEAGFDTRQLAYAIDVPLEHRAVVPLPLARRYDPSQLLDAAPPARFSAALNVFAGLSALSASETQPTGADRGDLTLGGAINYAGYVLEGTGTVSSDFRGDTDFTRTDVRLTRDLYERIIRLEAGDLTAPSTGLQARGNMAGLSAYRYFGQRPYQRFSPTPEQEFELARPARAAIYINGRYAQEIRLRPGRYRLTDLPLRSASGNDVQIELRYDTGEVEVLSFPAFFDLQLLRPGVSEFAVSGGVSYRLVEGERRYDTDRPAISAFYRRGLSDTLTVGADIQADPDVALVGGQVLAATAFGTVGLLAANNFGESDGLAVTALYRWAGTDYRRQATADAQIRYAGAGYRTLRQNLEPVFEYGARGRVGFNLTDTRRVQFTADYQRIRESGFDEYSAEALVSQRTRYGTFALSSRWERLERGDDLSVRLSFSAPLGRGTVAASYDSANDSYRAVYNRPVSPGVDKFGYSANFTSFDGLDDLSASGFYRGNRFEGTLEQRFSESSPDAGLGSEIRTTAFAGTALVTAGGRVALSRPVYDGFAIIAPREAVRDYAIGADPQARFATAQRDYNARSGPLGPAVIPDLAPFLVRTLEVEAIDAPPGISIGAEAYTVIPGYRTGYLIEVGDAGNVALIGSLVDQAGQPVAFAAGVARIANGDDVDERPVFTNAGGRFYVDGVVAGAVVAMEFEGRPNLRANVRAPEGAVGVVRFDAPVTAVSAAEFDGSVQAPPHTSDFRQPTEPREPQTGTGGGAPPDAAFIPLSHLTEKPWDDDTRKLGLTKGTRKESDMKRWSMMGAALAAAAAGGPSALAADDDAGAAAQPPCELALRAPASVYFRGARSRGYEVFSDARHQEQVQIQVEHRGGPCDWSLTVGSATSPTLPALEGPGGGRLEYEVREDPNGENLLTADFSSFGASTLAGAFGEGSQAEVVVLFIEIPPGQIAPAGAYQDALTFRLFREETGQELVDERGLFVTADVPASLQAGIGASLGTGMSRTDVDLGQLRSGMRRALNFTARTNTDVNIGFASDNDGRLRHEHGRAYVPYSIVFRGETFSPGEGGVRFSHEASPQPETHQFEVLIGDIPGGGLAGAYSDTLTVTITPA
ncbi:fimbrial biogenesis outer membrane usher protein [Glycocaulis profundi]|nr:fimbrial biogenesis outer membrane usher protein [Glycocaulis profundi]